MKHENKETSLKAYIEDFYIQQVASEIKAHIMIMFAWQVYFTYGIGICPCNLLCIA